MLDGCFGEEGRHGSLRVGSWARWMMSEIYGVACHLSTKKGKFLARLARVPVEAGFWSGMSVTLRRLGPPDARRAPTRGALKRALKQLSAGSLPTLYAPYSSGHPESTVTSVTTVASFTTRTRVGVAPVKL